MAADIKNYPGKRVHFIGVGGSSMSGLAGLLNAEGYRVSGSARTRSHKTDALADKGVRIHIGHDAGNVADADTRYAPQRSEYPLERRIKEPK